MPCALMPNMSHADEEGFVECNVHLHNGEVAAVLYRDDDRSIARVNCAGCVCLPCFRDCHTHLIKTEIAPRNRNETGSISGALACELQDQPRWNYTDVSRRMDFALRCAYHHGTNAIRTHLDGCAAENAELRDIVYRAFDEAREKYAKMGLAVQGVANLYLPQYLEEPFASEHCARALSHANVVLGAYCGNVASMPHESVVAAMNALFTKAAERTVDVDMHIDETNDPDCCALLAVCESLRKARNELGYAGKVVLGHATALSLQAHWKQQQICAELAALGDVYVVANPFTNLGLQDRRGSAKPHSLDIDKDVPRTPQWRGITLLQELRAAGVTVAAASDNVRDHWFSYGDYDCLSVWAIAQALAHLDTAPNEGSWADLITDAPARAMNLPGASSLSIGEPADFILFPNAKRASELFARPHQDRIVLRRGKCQTSELPDFDEIDDLVAVKTAKPTPDAIVMRGATSRKVPSGMM